MPICDSNELSATDTFILRQLINNLDWNNIGNEGAKHLSKGQWK